MEKLQAYITAHGIRQSAFADMLGVTRGYFNEIYHGTRRPGIDLALKIERETGGKVPVSCWQQRKRRPSEASA